ncbi:hypothetical protein XH93_22515 [Bradyrhizobium sp. CCBAU 51753]|nr:hypothetical protein XH93_22515 [Bradyrhizobium sp. CCBAU 51753]
MALFELMKKRDWAFVAACAAGALLFGVWSVQMGIAYHRSRLGVTDLSSSHRQAGHRASSEGSAADELESQIGRPQ